MGQARTVPTPPAPKRPAKPKGKAKGKGAPAKQKQQVSTKLVARTIGKSVFDPTNTMIPPVLISQLGVFPIQNTYRSEVFQSAGTQYFVMVSAIPGRGTSAVFGFYNPVATTVIPLTQFQPWTFPLLALTGHSGGPTASRCTKVGVRITNATPNLTCGGRVYVSNLNQRVKFPGDPATMTGVNWSDMMATIRSLPEPMTMPETWKSFSEKRKDKPIYCRVVDEVKYQDYNFHNGPCPDAIDFFDHVGTWTTAVEEPRPMSTVIISWTAATTAANLQDLTFNVDAQYLTRWPIDSVPGQNARDVSGSPPADVNATR